MRPKVLANWEMSPSRRLQGRKKPSSGTIMADLSRWRTDVSCLLFITLRRSFMTARLQAVYDADLLELKALLQKEGLL